MDEVEPVGPVQPARPVRAVQLGRGLFGRWAAQVARGQSRRKAPAEQEQPPVDQGGSEGRNVDLEA
ncbi:MAG TPA: hypothetical protein VMW62_13440 [Chloroflexota bacterium]|nr:hypothetical protein [Chloroflexota bacterium]